MKHYNINAVHYEEIFNSTSFVKTAECFHIQRQNKCKTQNATLIAETERIKWAQRPSSDQALERELLLYQLSPPIMKPQGMEICMICSSDAPRMGRG